MESSKSKFHRAIRNIVYVRCRKEKKKKKQCTPIQYWSTPIIHMERGSDGTSRALNIHISKRWIETERENIYTQSRWIIIIKIVKLKECGLNEIHTLSGCGEEFAVCGEVHVKYFSRVSFQSTDDPRMRKLLLRFAALFAFCLALATAASTRRCCVHLSLIAFFVRVCNIWKKERESTI